MIYFLLISRANGKSLASFLLITYTTSPPVFNSGICYEFEYNYPVSLSVRLTDNIDNKYIFSLEIQTINPNSYINTGPSSYLVYPHH